jgi:hypothetical protein
MLHLQNYWSTKQQKDHKNLATKKENLQKQQQRCITIEDPCENGIASLL